MKNIRDYNRKLLREMEERGMIYKVVSPDGKLFLYNYSKRCIYEKEWNEVTLNLRGHTFESSSGNMIAMAFPKFFNIFEYTPEEKKEIKKKTIYKCYEKIDGSLGIVYFYEGIWRMNTRGKFDSPQSIEGLKMLNEKYDLSSINKSYSILVEILLREFKIIIDYGEDKLVLLSAFDTSDDRELGHSELIELSKKTNIPIVKDYNYNIEELEELRTTLTKDFEGFVIRYKDNFRLKIKSNEYMRIAQLVENITPLKIWKNMKNGKMDEEILILIPEEFREITDRYVKVLEEQYIRGMMKRIGEYEYLIKEVKNKTGLEINDPRFRKEMGLRIRGLKYKECAFMILDKEWEKIDVSIMKEIRPDSNEM